MKRNRNVDILRDIALLIIIVYQAYVLCGTPWVARSKVHTLITFGGELGVTLFFVLSGYGIFMSLWNKEQSGNLPDWNQFIVSRCKRIMPQYYICVCFLLIFQSADLISASGLKHMIAYFTFTQNMTIETHGSINGALWTLATIFQFYLIALLLYKGVKKNWLISALGAIVITIASKWLIYNYFIPGADLDGSAYFVYGRQLISALDNFVLGMVAAKVTMILFTKDDKKYYLGIGSGLSVLLLVLLIFVSYDLSKNGLYGDSVRGYCGHSLLACLLAVLIIAVSLFPQIEGGFAEFVQFLAKNQYAVYLWHMPIIVSLYNFSETFQYLAHTNFILYSVVIIIVTITAGWTVGRISCTVK